MVQYVANLKGRNVGLIKTKWRSLYKDHVIWFASPSCPLPSRSFLKAKLDVRPKDQDLKVPWHHEENSWVVTPPIQIWCLMGFELNAIWASQDAWSTCKSIWGLSIQQKSNPNQPRDSPSGRRIDLSCLDATTQYMFSKNGKVEESRRMRIWPTKVRIYHVYSLYSIFWWVVSSGSFMFFYISLLEMVKSNLPRIVATFLSILKQSLSHDRIPRFSQVWCSKSGTCQCGRRGNTNRWCPGTSGTTGTTCTTLSNINIHQLYQFGKLESISKGLQWSSVQLLSLVWRIGAQ